MAEESQALKDKERLAAQEERLATQKEMLVTQEVEMDQLKKEKEAAEERMRIMAAENKAVYDQMQATLKRVQELERAQAGPSSTQTRRM